MIDFKMPKKGTAAFEAFSLCVDRASDLLSSWKRSRMDWVMDFAAVNATLPMDWESMARADDFNLVHDAAGIGRHLDRDDESPTAGQLLDCFLPRFARDAALVPAVGVR